jgi:hypothetical protein
MGVFTAGEAQHHQGVMCFTSPVEVEENRGKVDVQRADESEQCSRRLRHTIGQAAAPQRLVVEQRRVHRTIVLLLSGGRFGYARD